jgi:hypothetical protein
MSRSIIRTGELPLLLVALAMFLWLGFQTVGLVHDSQSLAAIHESQDQPLQETARLRDAANSLGADVAILAQQGDAGAKQVVAEMANQNIKLEPPGTAPPK